MYAIALFLTDLRINLDIRYLSRITELSHI